MEIDEAIKNLKKLKSYHNGSYGTAIDIAIKALEATSCIKEKCAYCPHCDNCDVDDETLEIKALEQQPNEDCISREDAIRIAEQGQIQGYEWQFKKLCTLPPVTPQPKIGHWINLGVMPSDLGDYRWCSNCNRGIDVMEFHRNHYNYCPNCGTKMA